MMQHPRYPRFGMRTWPIRLWIFIGSWMGMSLFMDWAAMAKYREAEGKKFNAVSDCDLN